MLAFVRIGEWLLRAFGPAVALEWSGSTFDLARGVMDQASAAPSPGSSWRRPSSCLFCYLGRSSARGYDLSPWLGSARSERFAMALGSSGCSRRSRQVGQAFDSRGQSARRYRCRPGCACSAQFGSDFGRRCRWSRLVARQLGGSKHCPAWNRPTAATEPAEPTTTWWKRRHGCPERTSHRLR